MSRTHWLIAACLVMVAAPIAAAAGEAQVTYAGKIVDEDGAPLAGVEVRVFVMTAVTLGERVQAVGEAMTEADGLFAIVVADNAAARPRFAMVLAEKQGLALGWVSFNSAPRTFVTITLGRPAVISGVVVDEKGAAIAGAAVSGMFSVTQMQQQHGGWIFGLDPITALLRQTDTEGRFSFNNLPADTKGMLLVSAPGRAGSTFRLGRDRTAQDAVGQTDIRIVLLPEAKVAGTVIHKDTGKPVAGVEIHALRDEHPMPSGARQPVVSDGQGRFALGALRSGGHGLYAIVDPIKHKGLAATVTNIDLQQGRTTSGVVVELSKAGMLEVVVIDQQDKSPVKGARTRVMDDQNPRVGTSTYGVTDGQGIARISLAPGVYRVRSVSAWPRYAMEHTAQVKTPVTIVAGKTQRVEVQLTPMAKLSGVVRGPDGQPVEGAALLILPVGGRPVYSNSQGAFEVAWDTSRWAGRDDMLYTLVARHTSRNLAAAIEVDAEATDPIEVKLQPGVTVTGSVARHQGQPIAGAALRLSLRGPKWSGRLPAGRSITTDAEGRYEVRALPPEHRLGISASAADFGRASVRVNLAEAADGRVEAPPMILNVANLSLAGTVVNKDTGKPVVGALVGIYGPGQPSRPSIKTDADGKFTFDKLCEGKVKLSASAADFLPTRRVQIELDAAGDHHVAAPPILLTPTIWKITGVVRDPEGQPVPGASIVLLTGRRQPVVESDARGTFMTTLDPTNAARRDEVGLMLLVRHTSRNLVAAVKIHAKTAGPIEVKLQPGVTLSGKVTGPQDKPIAKATMRIMLRGSTWSTALSSGRGITTDAAGRYEVKALPPGQRLSISASAADFLPTRQVQIELDAAGDRHVAAPPIVLTPTFLKITGVVRDPEGQPVPGASIVLLTGRRQPVVESDAQGTFTTTLDRRHGTRRDDMGLMLLARHTSRNLAAAVEIDAKRQARSRSNCSRASRSPAPSHSPGVSLSPASSCGSRWKPRSGRSDCHCPLA